MKYQVDREYLLNCFEKIISVPSPVGYYRLLNPVLEQLAKELGYSVTFDNKKTAYITIDGQDNSKSVLVGAHADTLGLMVRSVDSNGLLRVRRLGGVCFPSTEGESVTVFTRDGRAYTGMMICQSHSVHVFGDTHTLERNEDTMRVLLDEEVKTKADVRALGIQNGDFVALEPRYTVTEKGYIKSRFIDDKGAIACCFEALRQLKETGARPHYRTIFAFPYYEEMSLGGCYVPQGVSEYVAVDIGLIGPELEGEERAVSICAKDAGTPYDEELTSRMITCAQKAGCDYNVDVYYRYGTDAKAAQRGGNNLAVACFGMAVWCSHGMERTHILGLENTVNLILAYLLD